MIRILFTFLVSCVSVLVAQEATDPNRFVPADAALTVRVQSPAQWREAFAKTKLSKILGGSVVAPHLAKLNEAVQAAIDSADGQGMPREVLQRFWNDYRGEMVFSVCTDPLVDDDENVVVPTFAVMLAMSPDGTFLDELLAGFRKMDEKAVNPLVDVQMGDHRFRRTDFANSASNITQFEFVDGHLVLFLGSGIDKFGPAMLAATDRSTVPKTDAPLEVHGSLELFLDAVSAAANREAALGGELDVPMGDFMAALGLSSLRSVDFRFGARGDRVSCELGVSLEGEPGVFAAFFGDGKPSPLLRFLPSRADSYSISKFDPSALWNTVQQVFSFVTSEEEEAGAGGSFEEIEARIAEAIGVRLREDLLAHMGSSCLVLGDARSLMELVAEQGKKKSAVPDPNRVFAGYCFGLELRDGKAMARSIDTILRKSGLHAAHGTDEYRGQQIHTLRLGGVMVIEYAILDSLLLVVFGNRGDGADHLRSVLDTVADANPSPPESLARWTAILPEGWSGIEVMPLFDLLRTIAEADKANAAARGRMESEAYRLGQALHPAFLEEVRKLGADEVASATWATPAGFRKLWLW